MTSPPIVLRLYVIGSTPASARAIVNTRRLCDEQLPGRCSLEIIDIRERPQAAAEADLIAAPTLLKVLPLPRRRFIGDMSRRAAIVAELSAATA